MLTILDLPFVCQVGKWDAGMVTPTHTPHGRGYDSSLGYFGHGNWMWSEQVWPLTLTLTLILTLILTLTLAWMRSEQVWGGSYDHRADIPTGGVVDLWDTDKPARQLNGTGYEEGLFLERMLAILHSHDQATPLFLNYDSRLAHYPLQAPVSYQERLAFIPDDNRRTYHAMVAYLDDQIANVTRVEPHTRTQCAEPSAFGAQRRTQASASCVSCR